MKVGGDTVKPHGGKMEDTTEKKIIKRFVPRNPIEAEITCRPYTSSGAVLASDGVMRNSSSRGSYIETSHKYKSGTILIVQMVHYPNMPSTMSFKEWPRSLYLAEVKWQQELTYKNAIRFGMGLRYLD